VSEVRGILVCTVGGSPQPILTALEARAWDHVVFVCTRTAEGSAGSAAMVEEAVASGPPIPVLAGLDKDRFEIVIVPPDDPDGAFAVLHDKLQALGRAHPAASIVADFTGGTKSMSAALILAALGGDVPLQLVTGKRADLVKVLDRSERAVAVNTERIAAAREFERLAAGWSRFAYQEAAAGLARLRDDLKAAGLSKDALRRFTRAQELSEAFAAWDLFDHKKAAGCLQKNLYRGLDIGGRSDWHEVASSLARGQGLPWGALHLADLWRNAERCAARGRWDDAVARLLPPVGGGCAMAVARRLRHRHRGYPGRVEAILGALSASAAGRRGRRLLAPHRRGPAVGTRAPRPAAVAAQPLDPGAWLGGSDASRMEQSRAIDRAGPPRSDGQRGPASRRGARAAAAADGVAGAVSAVARRIGARLDANRTLCAVGIMR
jgi:CRISPR-associated protein (TIGR02710 family)